MNGKIRYHQMFPGAGFWKQHLYLRIVVETVYLDKTRDIVYDYPYNKEIEIPCTLFINRR